MCVEFPVSMTSLLSLISVCLTLAWVLTGVGRRVAGLMLPQWKGGVGRPIWDWRPGANARGCRRTLSA